MSAQAQKTGMTVYQLHRVYKDIWALAKHHLKILKRKFPSYIISISILEPTLQTALGGYPPFISVETDGPCGETILSAVFHPSSVTITSIAMEETIDYADPRFTDDFLSEIVGKFEHKRQKT